MDANTDRPEREQERDKDRNGWVVDRKTGRVVRRGSATLAAKVKHALVEAMSDGALALDPEEADVRAVMVATGPAEFAEPVPVAARETRPREAHPIPDARELGREHRGF